MVRQAFEEPWLHEMIYFVIKICQTCVMGGCDGVTVILKYLDFYNRMFEVSITWGLRAE